MVLAALAALRRIVVAPFGSVLRACRDAPARAEAIGIDVARQRWFAFALAGAFAGLGGGLLAFLKGTIDPSWLAVPQSVEGLVMVLLGGVHTLAGPLVGAAAYHGLEIWFSTVTRFWPLVLGLIIVALVLAFPRGIVGYAAARLPEAEGL
jgi:branched-chain amino acid transport system permease protein